MKWMLLAALLAAHPAPGAQPAAADPLAPDPLAPGPRLATGHQLSPADGPETVRIFDALVGDWSGVGQLFGQPTTFTMSWSIELGGSFARLRYEIIGERGMEAMGHYRISEDAEIAGVWVDSRGEILELTGEASDTRLEIVWRSPTETGRTTYELLPDGSLEARDSYHDGDDWREFAEALYTRRSPA